MRGAVGSLLVTDIVGSTRLWAEHESAMAVDLVSHDEVVNEAIAAAGGRVFKHTGDGVMATFQTAGASAMAAAEVQRMIGSHVWRVPDGVRVRVALHSGSVHERDGDLFGPPVNRLARLLSRCSPGAVIVSEATASLLTDGMPDGLDLNEIGRVELRDVGRSESVYCLVGEHLAPIELRDDIDAAGTRVGSLPPIDDDLVGRSAEIAAVLDAIAVHPVVSIVGVGGMGKTRLALETAAAAGLPDGAWWCDLTAATTPDAVPATVLAAVGGRQSAGRSAVESLVDHLATRYTLVVLDNCEHVVDAAHALVTAIRAGCDKVRVLATSREALGLRGEHVVSLSSLPTADAIGLFCTRAGEARADLVFDDAALAAIDEICTRLDGIPLAIELAAARCRSMAPAEIAARLDDRFRLLRGGRGGAERHRTLLAAVEWSYSLLDDEERALFDRMAVFAGGALIDAIAQVCDTDEYDALDVLDRLIARSMVVATATPLGTRYRQLETLRQYAEDRLVEADEIDRVRDRHLEWAGNRRLSYKEASWTANEEESFRRYVAEIDNLRAAVRYAVATGRDLEACRVIAGIGYWALLQPSFEVLDWLDASRIAPDAWNDDVVEAVTALAGTAIFAGKGPLTIALLAFVPESFASNIWMLQARVFAALWVTGEYELAEDLLAACRPHSELDTGTVALIQSHVQQTRLHTDRADDAEYADAVLQDTKAVVDRARACDARSSLVTALLTHGYCLEGVGDPAAAMVVQQEAIELGEAIGLGTLVDAARAGLIESITLIAAAESGDLQQAAVTLRTALADALARRNVLFVLTYMSGGIERLLWNAGDRHTAALLGRYARSNITTWTANSVVVGDALDTDQLGAINAEAATLDFEGACAIALAALNKMIDSA